MSTTAETYTTDGQALQFLTALYGGVAGDNAWLVISDLPPGKNTSGPGNHTPFFPRALEQAAQLYHNCAAQLNWVEIR